MKSEGATKTLYLPSISFEQPEEIWPADKALAYKNRSFKSLARRTLLMAARNDTVIIDRYPDPEYLSLLQSCGAGGRPITPSYTNGNSLSEDFLNSPELIDLAQQWQGDFELYMPGPVEEQIARLTGVAISPCSAAVAKLLNDKTFFMKLAEDIGAETVPTLIGNCDTIMNRTANPDLWPCLVRSARSIGGSGVWPVRNGKDRDNLVKRLRKSDKKRLFLVSPLLDILLSPNLQFYITDSDVHLVGVTRQILGPDLDHIGNLFDPPDDATMTRSMIETGAELCFELADLGYRGIVGVDFIISTDGAIYPVEINARHNSSTHALCFANRLLEGDAMTMTDPGRAAYCRFDSMAERSPMVWLELLGQTAFDATKRRGILPDGAGGDDFGCLIVGDDKEDRDRLIIHARKVALSKSFAETFPLR